MAGGLASAAALFSLFVEYLLQPVWLQLTPHAAVGNPL